MDDDAEAYELDQLCQDHEGEDDWKEDRDHEWMREMRAFDEMDEALALMAEAQIGFLDYFAEQEPREDFGYFGEGGMSD